VGVFERAKYHWKKNHSKTVNVYVLSAANPALPMNTDGLFAKLYNPPKSLIINASTLDKKERKTSANTGASILKLETVSNSWSYRRKDKVVWRDAGNAKDFNTSDTFYYVPLNGYKIVSIDNEISDAKKFIQTISKSGLDQLASITVYGVRKVDLEYIKTLKNWKCAQTHVKTVLANLNPTKVVSTKQLDFQIAHCYHESIHENITSPTSEYSEFVSKYAMYSGSAVANKRIMDLASVFGTSVNIEAMVQAAEQEKDKFDKKYPLLKMLSDNNSAFSTGHQAVADYINLIDSLTKEKE
jgi:hypothetical protein